MHTKSTTENEETTEEKAEVEPEDEEHGAEKDEEEEEEDVDEEEEEDVDEEDEEDEEEEEDVNENETTAEIVEHEDEVVPTTSRAKDEPSSQLLSAVGKIEPGEETLNETETESETENENRVGKVRVNQPVAKI